MTSSKLPFGQTSSGSAIVFDNGDVWPMSSGTGGELVALSGATATPTPAVRAGAAQNTTGITTGVVELSGGVYQGSAPSLSGALVGTGSSLLVLLSGVVTSAVVAGGDVEVSSGGVASGDLVESGGVQNISGGGLAIATQVLAGGSQTVSSGGRASGAAVGSGGVETVQAGGTDVATLVGSGGSEVVAAGVAHGLAVQAGGSLLELGGSVSGLSFASGATGSADNVTLVNGNVAIGLVVVGEIFVGAGAVTSSTDLPFSPDALSFEEVVLPGGKSVSATVDGQTELVSSGGVASGAHVFDGGLIGVNAGGTEVGTFDENDSDEIFGTASASMIGSAGNAFVASGGSAVAMTVSGARALLSVLGGGTASGTTILAGGVEQVGPGGIELAATIAAGSAVVSGGGTGSFVLQPAGTLDVFGAASVSFVAQGGTLIVDSGFVADHLAAASQVETLVVASAGTDLGGTVSGGRTLVVQSGGTASGVNVSGGTFELYAGAVVTSGALSGAAEIIAGGYVQVGATVDTQTLVSLLVSSGSIASGSFVAFGGTETVGAGGSGVSDIVDTGGIYEVASGGLALDPALRSGSVAVVDGTMVMDQAAPNALDGVVGGGGGLVLSGARQVRLSQADSYTGGTVVSGGVLELMSAATAGTGAITFAAVASGAVVSATLRVDGRNQTFANVLSGFAAGDTVDLFDTAYDPADRVDLLANNVLQVTQASGPALEFQLDPTQSFAGDYFHATNLNGLTITEDTNACYCPGTRILTPDGERPVEDLVLGDRIVTGAGAAEPIRWIGRRSYAGRFLRPAMRPMVIAAGALGGGLPRRDLRISPHHALLLEGVLVEARHLVNGTSIRVDTACARADYLHLELSVHGVIWAEGAAGETFVDDDSRAQFHNAAEHAALYPVHEPGPALYCAPRVQDGPRLDAIRRRIDAEGIRLVA